MQYGSRAARVASRGGQEKRTILTAYVLYCFDARGVIIVRYGFSLGSFLCIVVVRGTVLLFTVYFVLIG